VEEHVSFVPLGVQCPVLGAEKLSVCLSGLDEGERWATGRLIRMLGTYPCLTLILTVY
jgi:hypothetical protein